MRLNIDIRSFVSLVAMLTLVLPDTLAMFEEVPASRQPELEPGTFEQAKNYGVYPGVYQPIINIKVPNDRSACDYDKVGLDELKERFNIQESKLDRILEMLSTQLCPCRFSDNDDNGQYSGIPVASYSSSQNTDGTEISDNFSSLSNKDTLVTDYNDLESEDYAQQIQTYSPFAEVETTLIKQSVIVNSGNLTGRENDERSTTHDDVTFEGVNEPQNESVDDVTSEQVSIKSTVQHINTSTTTAQHDSTLESYTTYSVNVSDSYHLNDLTSYGGAEDSNGIDTPSSTDQNVAGMSSELVEFDLEENVKHSSGTDSLLSQSNYLTQNSSAWVSDTDVGLPTSQEIFNSEEMYSSEKESFSNGTSLLTELTEQNETRSTAIVSPDILTAGASIVNSSTIDNVISLNTSFSDRFVASEKYNLSTTVSSINESVTHASVSKFPSQPIDNLDSGFQKSIQTDQLSKLSNESTQYEESEYDDYFSNSTLRDSYSRFDIENSSSYNGSVDGHTSQVDENEDVQGSDSSEVFKTSSNHSYTLPTESSLTNVSDGSSDYNIPEHQVEYYQENNDTDSKKQPLDSGLNYNFFSQNQNSSEEANTLDESLDPGEIVDYISSTSISESYSENHIDSEETLLQNEGSTTPVNKPVDETASEYFSYDKSYQYSYEYSSSIDDSLDTCPPPSLTSNNPKDCDDIALTVTTASSGEYCVYPTDGQGSIRVYCKIDEDGGGWTVIQRHNSDGDFFRTWNEYSNGFGQLSGDFWLGNENIHRLTTQDVYKLRIDLEDYLLHTAYAEYDSFSIGTEELLYQLALGHYTGNAGDSLRWHNHHGFSTWDADHDDHSSGNCAQIFRGGWWYTSCLSSNLNGGIYPPGNREMGIVWTHFQKGENLKSASMMIQRINRPIVYSADKINAEAPNEKPNEKEAIKSDSVVDDEKVVDLKPKTKKNKFEKIFKNFYNKW